MVVVDARGLVSRRGGILIDMIIYWDGRVIEYSDRWQAGRVLAFYAEHVEDVKDGIKRRLGYFCII